MKLYCIIKLYFMMQRMLDLGDVQRLEVLVPTTCPGINYLITCTEDIVVMCYQHDMVLAVPRTAN